MVNSHLTVMDPDDRQGLIARSAVRKKNAPVVVLDPISEFLTPGGSPGDCPTREKKRTVAQAELEEVSAGQGDASPVMLQQIMMITSATIVNKGSCFQNESPSGRSRTCPFVILGARSAPNDVAHANVTFA